MDILDKIDRVREEVGGQIRSVGLPNDLAIHLRHAVDREINNAVDRYFGNSLLLPTPTPTPYDVTANFGND
jgi:hypothetical protein